MAHPIKRVLVPALLVGALALAGCSEAEPDKVAIGGMDVTAVDTVERPWGTVKVAPRMEKAEEPGDVDVAFVADMVMHHEQAIELSDNVLAHEGVDDRIAAAARFILADQQNEIGIMTSWLTAWDVTAPEHDAHAAGAMPGMLPKRRVRQIAVLPTAASQVAFLTAMVEHHEGAIAMSRDYLPVQANTFVRTTAQHIITEQLTEVTYMENLVDELCADGGIATCPADR